MRLVIGVLLLVFASGFLYAQNDKIILVNGKIISNIKITESENIRDVAFQRNNKIKLINKIDIFSVVQDNVEIMVYQQDTLQGQNYTTEEMRNFVIGHQVARENYHAYAASVVGFAVGASAPWIMKNVFIASAFPVVFTGIIAIKTPYIKNKSNIDPQLLANNEFVVGYKHYAHKRKITNAIIGSLAGYFISSTIYTLTRP